MTMMDTDFLILLLGFFSVPISLGYLLIWAVKNGYFNGKSCTVLPREEQEEMVKEGETEDE